MVYMLMLAETDPVILNDGLWRFPEDACCSYLQFHQNFSLKHGT
jgi:hypothetical protein